MQLIGYLDSPFVRRVAVTMNFLGVEYQHRELSIFRDYDEFRTINPMVKVPTLVLDDGRVLGDSTLIIDYLESQVAGRSLMPADDYGYFGALQNIGTALVAMEKVAQLVYETSQRPENLQHGPWIKRLEQQLKGAAGMMESVVSASANLEQQWLHGDEMTQADISVAIAWRFMMFTERVNLLPDNYPALAAFSARAEALPEFSACPLNS
ncbi:MAG: glutathione S-transferase family protein [Xanthomonadales bacterium]|nr:glutathione S-transferase family protein [Xanthomonadales bacterium]MDH4018368.1 glutathione S-transferase family protein [Xanthomonadales bacterium]